MCCTGAGPALRARSQAMQVQAAPPAPHAAAEAAADRVMARRRAGRVMGWSLFYYFLSMVRSPPQGGPPQKLRVAALKAVLAPALEHTRKGVSVEATKRGQAGRAWVDRRSGLCVRSRVAAPQDCCRHAASPKPVISRDSRAGARCQPGRRAAPHDLTAAQRPGRHVWRRADRPYPAAAQVLAVWALP